MKLNKEALVQEIINATTEEVARYIASAIESAVNVAQYEVMTLKEELQRARQELEHEERARQQRASRQKHQDMFNKLININE